MTRRRQVLWFWVAAVATLIVVLFVLSPILLPFVAGAAFAYLLDPAVGALERRGVNRTAATAAVLGVVTIVLIAVILLLVPLLIDQTAGLVRGLPAFVARLQELATPVFDSDWARFLGLDPTGIREAFAGLTDRGIEIAGTVLFSLWTGGRAVIDIVFLLTVMPFVAFYLLRDWERIVAWVDGLLPRDEAGEFRLLAGRIDGKIAAFVRGQFLSGLILGIFYASGLVAVGLNYGLLIGLLSGILSFIPYLGFAVGFILSILIAVAQFWPDWIWIAAVIAVFMVGQVLEGYVLQPFLIGHSVGMHPVWVLFALFAFGYLFGFLGLLVAIPAAAAVGVVAEYAIERYRTSAIYTGEP